MAQRNVRMISVSEKNYDILRELGSVTDTFDGVITKLIETAMPLLQEKSNS